MSLDLDSLLHKDIVIPEDPGSLSLQILIAKIKETESCGGRPWTEGWQEFFWRIGSSKKLWDKYLNEPWVQPGIKDLCPSEDEELIRAACSARFPSLGRVCAVPVCQVGNVRLLEFLLSQKRLWWKPCATLEAAKKGHLEVLQFCVDHRLPLHSRTAEVCEELRVLRFCLEKIHTVCWDVHRIAIHAAHSGNLSFLQYLYARHHVWSPTWNVWAAIGEHLGILEYAVKMKHHLPWNDLVPKYAVLKKNIPILQLYLDNQGPWPTYLMYYVAESGDLDLWTFCMDKKLHEGLIAQSILRVLCRSGHLHFLKDWGVTRGLGFGATQPLIDEAALSGHVEIVAFLFERSSRFSPDTLRQVTRRGHLNVLSFLIDQNVDFPRNITQCAALHGHLHILNFFMERNIDRHPQT